MSPAPSRLSAQLRGLVTMAGSLAGSATVAGFLGPLHWVLDLFSHFRVQYAVVLGGAALLLLVPRRRLAAVIFGALWLANVLVMAPHHLAKQVAVPPGADAVRVMLINVNSRLGQAEAVARTVRQYAPDVIVLEEVTAKWLSDLRPALTCYPHVVSESREDNFGIALYSRLPLADALVVQIGRAGVPSIVAEVRAPAGAFRLLATHPLPPAGGEYTRLRDGHLSELPRWLPKARLPALLLGDLNVTPWNAQFRRLLRGTGMQDSCRGRGGCATWPTFNPLLRIPLDHCLLSPELVVVDRQRGPHVGSDHFPLIVDFVIPRGPAGATR